MPSHCYKSDLIPIYYFPLGGRGYNGEKRHNGNDRNEEVQRVAQRSAGQV